MKQIPDEFALFGNGDLIETSDDGNPGEFFFDDEPLDHILYGADLSGPSPANLYTSARKYVQKIVKACNEGKVDDVIVLASELGGNDIGISGEMCFGLAAAIASFFPYYPIPVMKHDLRPLRPLFEKIWRIAQEKGDAKLQEIAGNPVFRWYEHHGMYEEARQVLGDLIEISRGQNNRSGEAIYLNNLGFEYLLEQRWNEAIPYFEDAVRIFKKTDITFEAVNARANYLTCRVELDDLNDDVENIELELKEILQFFSGSGRWYERKPLILLAKIEEKRGNIDKAIGLVEKAIESARDSNTKYPEIDGEYLRHLKRKSG